MNFLLLKALLNLVWAREKQKINALPRHTMLISALAFTGKQIIKQKSQGRLLLPIGKPLSSVPESQDSVHQRTR